jgi:hypothetical protein
MKPFLAALLAAGLLVPLFPAARARAQAAVPFERVSLERPPGRPHRLAWTCLATGAGLVGASFAITDRANRAYDEYLRSTEPDEIGRLYDRAVRDDRLSAAALLTGEALLATGIWLRFLHRPPPSRLAVVVESDRCALSLRF